MVMPLDFAILQAARQLAAALSLKAGVMPVKWNHVALWKMASQSKSDTVAKAIAEEIQTVI